MLNPWIISLAITGFLISLYIFARKKRGEKLYCPLGKHCNEVVTSPYSKTFGVPNEILGLIYYLLILAGWILVFFGVKAIFDFELLFLMRFVAGISALLSWYLLFIQIFILRKFCEWCTATSAINIILFFLIK